MTCNPGKGGSLGSKRGGENNRGGKGIKKKKWCGRLAGGNGFHLMARLQPGSSKTEEGLRRAYLEQHIAGVLELA